MRAPVYDVGTAVDVLGGRGCPTLPAVLEVDYAPPAVAHVDADAALASLEYSILEALCESELPPGLDSVAVEDAQAVLETAGHFRVHAVPLRTAPKEPPQWAIIRVQVRCVCFVCPSSFFLNPSLQLLVCAADGAPCALPQHAEELRRRAQRHVRAGGLSGLYAFLHDTIAVPLQLGVLRGQLEALQQLPGATPVTVEPPTVGPVLRWRFWGGEVSVLPARGGAAGLECHFGADDAQWIPVDPARLDAGALVDRAVAHASTARLRAVAAAAPAAGSDAVRLEATAAAVGLWLSLAGDRWARLLVDRRSGALQLQLAPSAAPCIPGGPAQLEQSFASTDHATVTRAHLALHCAALTHAAVVTSASLGALSVVQAPVRAPTTDGASYVQYTEARTFFVAITLDPLTLRMAEQEPDGTLTWRALEERPEEAEEEEGARKRHRTEPEDVLAHLRRVLPGPARDAVRRLNLLRQLRDARLEPQVRADGVIVASGPTRMPVTELDARVVVVLRAGSTAWSAVVRAHVPLTAHELGTAAAPPGLVKRTAGEWDECPWRVGADGTEWRWSNEVARDGSVAAFLAQVDELAAALRLGSELEELFAVPENVALLREHCVAVGARVTPAAVWLWAGDALAVRVGRCEGRMHVRCFDADERGAPTALLPSMNTLCAPFFASLLQRTGAVGPLLLRALEVRPVIQALRVALEPHVRWGPALLVSLHTVGQVVLRCDVLFAVSLLCVPNTHLVLVTDAYTERGAQQLVGPRHALLDWDGFCQRQRTAASHVPEPMRAAAATSRLAGLSLRLVDTGTEAGGLLVWRSHVPDTVRALVRYMAALRLWLRLPEGASRASLTVNAAKVASISMEWQCGSSTGTTLRARFVWTPEPAVSVHVHSGTLAPAHIGALAALFTDPQLGLPYNVAAQHALLALLAAPAATVLPQLLDCIAAVKTHGIEAVWVTPPHAFAGCPSSQVPYPTAGDACVVYHRPTQQVALLMRHAASGRTTGFCLGPTGEVATWGPAPTALTIPVSKLVPYLRAVLIK